MAMAGSVYVFTAQPPSAGGGYAQAAELTSDRASTVALGYAVAVSPDGSTVLAGAPDSDGVVRTLDRTKPVFDKARGNANVLLTYRTRLFSNRIGTRFQLNVNNVTESGRLQPIAVNPDGRPWNFRIIDPRQFIFTTTFDL